ncbi:hypothetical protein BDP55DRAFT_53175 [Colletotrichum godetiae]|uniref:Myb-like domain-containing protein n=1 Tax=Colletotrichum godetiae TaxID=1209918 RepID=A0AAJ0A6H3_9PEZI|nr:uncharacterized protein BDP55DRAFT_53175 [Colletotrichum godetiae]KAK1656969.1 hypothetical protein BDP55DRAFT_53175 [Colletotrichum godetiae]
MSIDLDNILFYVPPAPSVPYSAVKATNTQSLSPSCPTTERTKIPLCGALISDDETTSHIEDRFTVSSQLHLEPTIDDTPAPEGMDHLFSDCCPVSSDTGHGPAEKSVAVDVTQRENQLEPGAWSSNDLPISLPSAASGHSTYMPAVPPSPQNVETTTNPTFPETLIDTTSGAGFEPSDKESPTNFTGQQRRPPTSQAAGDGFLTWLQPHQTIPAKSTKAREAPESPSQKSNPILCPSSTETEPPFSARQDTLHYTHPSTRQPILPEEIRHTTTNIGARGSDLALDDAPDPQITGASPLPSPRIRHRVRKTRLPAGAYAEPDSDPESGDEDGAKRNNDDRTRPEPPGDDGSSGQRGQSRHERRKRDHSLEIIGKSRALRPRKAPSRPSVGTRMSCASSDDEPGPEVLFARYDEFSLQNAVLKRTVEGCVITYQLQWEQPAERQLQCHSSGSLGLRPSPGKPSSPRQPSRRRGPFSKHENELLIQLKGEGLSWKEIYNGFSASFPGRSLGTLQVHFSTKLKRLRTSC